MRVIFGWIIAGLGVLVILAVFGLNVFGVSAPFPPLGQLVVGAALILLGYWMVTGRPALSG